LFVLLFTFVLLLWLCEYAVSDEVELLLPVTIGDVAEVVVDAVVP
jgi:hypothetical protein